MLIRRIRLQNVLSFGPDAQELDLKPLNVLIGPNGSGKSNLIEAIALLQAAPRELVTPILEGGGSADWLWRGEPAASSGAIEVVLVGFRSSAAAPLSPCVRGPRTTVPVDRRAARERPRPPGEPRRGVRRLRWRRGNRNPMRPGGEGNSRRGSSRTDERPEVDIHALARP